MDIYTRNMTNRRTWNGMDKNSINECCYCHPKVTRANGNRTKNEKTRGHPVAHETEWFAKQDEERENRKGKKTTPCVEREQFPVVFPISVLAWNNKKKRMFRCNVPHRHRIQKLCFMHIGTVWYDVRCATLPSINSCIFFNPSRKEQKPRALMTKEEENQHFILFTLSQCETRKKAQENTA